ncbi:MAG TPA: hypothetical protein VJ453_07690 [Terriglobales bacterium]|nr:hypothetical protein [Terriglobales bacterium]
MGPAILLTGIPPTRNLKLETRNFRRVAIVESMEPLSPTSPPQQRKPGPQRSLFWILISIIGISMPKQGQESKAMLMIIIAAIVFVGFLAAAILALFRFW